MKELREMRKQDKMQENQDNIDKYTDSEIIKLDNIPEMAGNTIQTRIIPNIPVENDKQLHTQPIRTVNPDISKPRETHGTTIVPQNVVNAPPLDESGDIDLNKLFSSEVGNESDVVKELFSMENIKVKTDLSSNETSIIARLELQASMTQNFYLTKVIKELETLRVSKGRLSRQEFVNSFRGIGDANSGASVFSKLGNVFKNDKV
jgi:hypothetical protein